MKNLQLQSRLEDYNFEKSEYMNENLKCYNSVYPYTFMSLMAELIRDLENELKLIGKFYVIYLDGKFPFGSNSYYVSDDDCTTENINFAFKFSSLKEAEDKAIHICTLWKCKAKVIEIES